MSFAVMPLSDYKAACDKVREKVDITGVKFEETDFGFLRSEVFTVPQDSVYIFSYEFSDPSKFPDLYYSSPEWEGETSPGYFEPIDSNSAETASKLYAGVQYRIFIADSLGLTPKDILKASLLLDEETVADFVAPPKIKSGELADKVEKVYKAGASDFGLKGKGQGELVHFENVHPIEHKVEVGLSSKNLFNEDTANITKTDDYFASNISYWQGPCLTIPVESGATYYCSCEIYTPNITQFNQIIAFSLSTEKTYTTAAKALMLGLKTENSTNGFSATYGTFTVPEGIEEIYFLTNADNTYFKNFMLKKGTTATAYSPFVADFSDCKVTASGKNLFNLVGREVVNFGAGANTTKRTFYNGKAIILGLASNNHYTGKLQEYSVTKDTITCIQNGASYGLGFDIKIEPNTTYKFSCAERTGETVRLVEYDSEGNYIKNTYIQTDAVTTQANAAWGVILFVGQTNLESSAVKPQLEKGTTATDYEPYIGAEYTAAADGTVEGVKSISPVMNLSTDKAGAVIDAECFLDPQAVITDLTNTVITLGGEI